MKRVALQTRIPNLTIFVGGISLLAFVTVDFVRATPDLPSAPHVAMWIALMSAAILFPVPRRGRGAPATMSCALEFGALLVFGAPIACWLAVAARSIGSGRKLGEARTLGDLGRSVAALVAGGRLYHSMGGTIGSALVLDAESIAALVAAALTFLVVFEGLPFLAGFLGLREPTRVRLRVLRESLLWQASLLPFGIPAAMVHFHLGLAGGTLIGLPLLIAAWARYVWKDARRGHMEATRTLMSALDAGDPFTRGHSYRIAKMSVGVGRQLGLEAHALEELEYAALLHDVGRTAVKHELLPRNPSLNPEQQSVLRQHPTLGGDIVARFGFYPGAADVVYAHHEQPDGKGYPRGLESSQIPVGSLIIMVVAAFDAMTSDRPYRRGLSAQAALEELRAHAATQFASTVVEALVTVCQSDALFDEFSEDVLAHYARGDGNSRALYEYLQRTGRTQPRTSADLDDLIGAEDVPELELPPEDADDDRSAHEKTLRISGDSAWDLQMAARTDVGCVRENNEDSFGMFEHAPNACVLIVADGMGGAAAGEVASRLAVETMRAELLQSKPRQPDESLRTAIQAANEAIRERASTEDDLYGMGTTCVAASIADMRLHVGHVGDSRAYLVDPGGITQITRDHNLAEELKCVVGAEGPEGAQHILTRSLGSRPGVDVDVSDPISLHERHVLVLCSDGLSNLVDADEIRELALENAPPEACERLVELARERGAPDNVTVVVSRVCRP